MAGEMQATPLGSEDAEAAARMTRLLRHTRETLLADELEDEAELLAHYQEGDDPGVGILKVAWKRERAVERDRLNDSAAALQRARFELQQEQDRASR